MRAHVFCRRALFILLFIAVWHWPVPARAMSEACQSLAAVYGRSPQYLDAKELVALQKCLEADAKERAEKTEEPPRRSRDWPTPPPWTPSQESWPSTSW